MFNLKSTFLFESKASKELWHNNLHQKGKSMLDSGAKGCVYRARGREKQEVRKKQIEYFRAARWSSDVTI